ncbi:MAG: hypothetical protein RJA59_1479 [Pseudomonadota bacterium]
MRWIGVLLNHSGPDGLDGRYSPQRENPEPLPDFAEDFDQYDVEPLPDMELEGD